jgi:ABC-type multidrug transport system fused ATPase/permease subunit
MTGFLAALLWAALQFVLAILLRAVSCILWLFWPAVLIGGTLGLLIATAHPAEAGWFSWLWGGSGTRHLERSLDAAHEAARVASQAAEAQAQQAAAQADQNSRVAEALAQLSAERQDYAGHLRAISESAVWDSQLAAVLNASGPVLICVCGLVVAGLALWLVSRNEAANGAELPGTVDLLLEELAAGLPENRYGHGGQHIGQASTHLPRLPLLGGGKGAGTDREDQAEMPF